MIGVKKYEPEQDIRTKALKTLKIVRMVKEFFGKIKERIKGAFKMAE